MAERQFTKLFGFKKGVIRRRTNLLLQPEDSLVDGKNFDTTSQAALKTRPGRVMASNTSQAGCPLPSSEIKVLGQVRFPTNEKTFIVAQVGEKIYACAAMLPVQDGTADWTEIYDFSICTGFANGICAGGGVSCAFDYAKTLLTGGTSEALDSVDGDLLSDGDRAIVFKDSGSSEPVQIYMFVLDASSSLSESSPNVITPDTNPGTKRWILAASPRRMHVGAAGPTVNDDADDGHRPMDIWHYNGSVWICADNTTGAAVWIEIESSPTPATTVTDETSFGISAAVGSSTNYALEDHTHGTPTNPVAGHESTYDHDSYDTHLAASAPHSGHEQTANKGNANGYAELDASGYVPTDQLGSGTPDGTKVLYDNNSWAVPPGASGGEANTASNQGGGLGLYKQKTGVDLEFKTLDTDQFTDTSDVISVDRIDTFKQVAVTAPAAPSSDTTYTYVTASGTTPNRTITKQVQFEDGAVAVIATTVV